MSRYECDQCGACCRFPIIEITELDIAREPRLMDVCKPSKPMPGAVYLDEDYEPCEPLVPGWENGAILACGATHPCPMLDGNLCKIYPTRPNCCVAFPPGSRLCQESRAAEGLPPLMPAATEEVARGQAV